MRKILDTILINFTVLFILVAIYPLFVIVPIKDYLTIIISIILLNNILDLIGGE